jgi:hypothetical protein
MYAPPTFIHPSCCTILSRSQWRAVRSNGMFGVSVAGGFRGNSCCQAALHRVPIAALLHNRARELSFCPHSYLVAGPRPTCPSFPISFCVNIGFPLATGERSLVPRRNEEQVWATAGTLFPFTYVDLEDKCGAPSPALAQAEEHVLRVTRLQKE